MRTIITLFTIIIISITSINAKEIGGKVLNAKLVPLQNASIYLKSDPTIRVFTNDKGEFILNFENNKRIEESSLVFSHIGYKTEELEVKELDYNKYHEIILVESFMVVDDIVVKSKKKLTRKERKNAKINIIKQFKKQLKIDFLLKDKTYKIISDIEILRDDERILYNKLTGDYTKLIKAASNNRDSIYLISTNIESYIDDNFMLGIDKMSDRFIDNNVVSKKRKENKRMMDSTFYQLFKNDSLMIEQLHNLHKALWGKDSRDMEYRIKFEGDIKHNEWEIIEKDKYTILRCENDFNLLWIVKYSIVTDYIVDPYDYSLLRVVERSKGEINIPFGYKLPPDALMLLNVINASVNDLEKYRVRHMNIDMLTGTIYKSIDGTKHLDETNFDLSISVVDTKKRDIELDFNALGKVLSVTNIQDKEPNK